MGDDINQANGEAKDLSSQHTAVAVGCFNQEMKRFSDTGNKTKG